MGEPTAVSLRTHHGGRSWSTDWYGPDRNERGELRRHYKRFGKESKMTYKGARAAFARWRESEWLPKFGSEEKSEVLNPPPPPPAYTVTDLRNDYLAHARTFYAKNGDATSHYGVVRIGTGLFSQRYGHLDPNALTAATLAEFRDDLHKPNRKGREGVLHVTTANHYLGVVKRMIKWGMERSHVETHRAGGLVMVRPLSAGRCAAKASEPVRPVSWSDVEATCKHVPKNVKAMILLQWHTGMRPGEVRQIRPCDVAMTGDVWKYTPASHKTQHKRKTRAVYLGRRCQKILTPYLKRRTDAYCFAPTESTDKMNLRRSPMFGTIQYGWIIKQAAKLANVPAWHAHQLRHSWATRIAELEGIEAAQDGLGHSSIDMTLIYAERSEKRAKALARKVG